MNEHIKEPLLNYTREENPGYAIMITGDWGIGKTHTITHLLPKEETHYISLYGLSSETEIHSSLFDVMYPDKKKIKKILNALNGVEFNGLGIRISPSNFLLSKFLSPNEGLIPKDKVLIFDDLERCNYDILKTLGVINKYIEHHGCRVLVICNDKELNTDISHIREKLFGLTLNIQADIETAYNAFTEKKIYSGFKDRLKPLIIEIFTRSQHKSLRILKHTINDCLHLYTKLEEKHKENEKCITDLFSLFLAFSIEARAGNLCETDLTNRLKSFVDLNYLDNSLKKLPTWNVSAKREEKKQPEETQLIPELSIKYININLNDNILSDNSLINMLFKGNFDKNEICMLINRSKYFLQEKSVPNWRIVYNFHSLEDNILDRALADLDNEFNERKLTITGQILHMFHLRFLCSCLRENSFTYDEIEKQCIEYIDDLFYTSKLEPEEIPIHGFEMDSVYSSYENYGYWIDDTYESHVARIKAHLKKRRKSVLENSFPLIQKNLLYTMKNNPNAFAGLVAFHHFGPATYGNVEILAGIPVKSFVNTWLSLPKENWLTISLALVTRYKNGRLFYWEKEAEWIKEIMNELNDLASQKKGLKKFQIIFLTIKQLQKIIEQ
ncbi:KAP P-loop domain protein [Kosakonia radicincitans]|uniref:P-loop NTPase fold protein n=1 Tax=Kosakonia radicincitans TaxID=283686 RepID=UPI001181E281|nr:P-loop NTPase fold protein [Kosakonia radicincitans]VVT53012.1 KAP P-loop domain protein [Kosakonia radicincitans]